MYSENIYNYCTTSLYSFVRKNFYGLLIMLLDCGTIVVIKMELKFIKVFHN